MVEKIIKKVMVVALVFCMVLNLTACGNNTKKADTSKPVESKDVNTGQEDENSISDKEYQEVEIENYDHVLKFEKAPEKVVSLTYNSAEMLAALGVAETLIGIAPNENSVKDVLPEYQNALKNIPNPDSISQGIPTLENIVALAPDMLLMNFYYFNAPVFGSYEEYNKNGINLYVMEGTYVENPGIETMYNDLLNLGRIFGRSEEAETLIESYKERIDKVQKAVVDEKKIKVMAVGSIDEGPCIAGGSGLENSLVSLAGGENVFNDIEKQFARVGWEEVIDRNPDVIVINSSGEDNNGQDKIDLLKSKPELAELNAIKNNKFFVVKLFTIFPGIQNVNVVEDLAKYMYPEQF